jgi:DNA-binding NarL/FixJ family response regulator
VEVRSKGNAVELTDSQKLEVWLFGLSRKLLALNVVLKRYVSVSADDGRGPACKEAQLTRLAATLLSHCVLEIIAISKLQNSPLSEITPKILLDYDDHFSTEASEAPPGMRDKSSVNSLSKRECQVIQYLGMGKSNKEVAVELGLSVKTVETYRGRIMMKLNAHSVSDLVHFAIRHTLVEI